MRVRDPGGAEDEPYGSEPSRPEPLRPRPSGPRPPDNQPSHDQPTPTGPATFRVPTGVLVTKFALAAVLAVAAVLSGDRVALVVGLVAAAGLLAYGVRDVLARERLRADRSGLDVVRGYTGRRHLDWDEVERVRVDERLRFGVRSQLLEVDADDELYLFSRYDLGVDPAEAITAITAQRP